MPSIKKNYFYNLFYQIIMIITPLITTPYISRTLGAENIGIFEFTNSITSYFLLFGGFGLAMYGQREAAYLKKDKQAFGTMIYEVIFLKIIFMCISVLIFICTFVLLSKYKIYYLLMIINFMTLAFDVTWVFQGIEDFKIIVLRNTVIRLIGIVLIFLTVNTENDLTLYFICILLPNLFGSFALWPRLIRHVGKPQLIPIKSLRHFAPALAMFIPEIAVSIYTVLDRTMLGIMSNDIQQVAYYGQSEKIVKISLTAIGSMTTVMLPRIATLNSEYNAEAIKNGIERSATFVLFLSIPMSLGIIGISESLVPWFFGAGYEPVTILLRLFSPLLIFIGLNGVYGRQYLIAVKRQKEFNLLVIIGAIFNFFTNLIVIRKYGANGAAVTSVSSEMLILFVLLYFVRKEFSILEPLRKSVKFAISGIIMFLCIIALSNVLPSYKPITTLIQIVVGTFIYFSSLLLFKDKFFMTYALQILSIIKVKCKKRRQRLSR